jgi:transcription initiation factor TFIIB
MAGVEPAVAPSDSCPSCHTPITLNRGERVCSNCGLVVEPQVIEGFIGSFPNSEGMSRSLATTHSAEPLRMTQISRGYRDANGSPIRNFKGYLRRVDGVRGRKDLRRGDLRPDIVRLCDQMGWPRRIVDEACILSQRLRDAGMSRGRRAECIAAVSVAMAARRNGFVFSFRELGQKTSEPWNRIATVYRDSKKILHMPIAFPKSEDYLRRAAIEFSVERSLRDEAINTARRISEDTNTTIQPASVAAATALHIWGRPYGLTQARVAKAFGITEVSVRSAVRRIRGTLAAPC